MILSQKILFLMLILMVLNLLGTMGDLALLVVGARLDMCLVNFNWSHCFSSYFISHLPRICSNHSLLLIFVLSWTPTKTRIFRFENYWLEYAQCHSCHYIVKSSQDFKPHSSPMNVLNHLLCRVKCNLLDWRINGLNSLDKDIRIVEALIEDGH